MDISIDLWVFIFAFAIILVLTGFSITNFIYFFKLFRGYEDTKLKVSKNVLVMNLMFSGINTLLSLFVSAIMVYTFTQTRTVTTSAVAVSTNCNCEAVRRRFGGGDQIVPIPPVIEGHVRPDEGFDIFNLPDPAGPGVESGNFSVTDIFSSSYRTAHSEREQDVVPGGEGDVSALPLAFEQTGDWP